MHIRALVVALAVVIPALPAHADQEAAIEFMQEYVDFVEYQGATIRPEQIPEADWSNFLIIDTRDAGQYASEHIPGAINIEWRQALSRRDELPADRPILVYCNTGTVSAQAGFMLRVAGMENVRILQGGLREWKEKGGFKANTIAHEAAGE